MPRPPADLRAVLEPVELLWARLDRPYAQRLVEAAVRSELTAVAGYVGWADAGQALADRLTRRLSEQGGTQAVTDPVGWLIRRGLPQRPRCADVRCDEGLRLDTGGDCATCTYLAADRRARRHSVAAAVDTDMPHASDTERRAETERRLHQSVTAEAWAKKARREQLEAEGARRQAAAAQTHARARRPGESAPARAGSLALPAPRSAPAGPEIVTVVHDDEPIVLEELTRDQVLDWRSRAAKDHQIVLDHITEYGEPSARRLFTSTFVDQVHRLQGARHLVLGHTMWG
ncbi:hypothetical protein [Streptomyces sp. ISL-10]|uniref:hypothetical protein n=1 Tax=Streptomyces sp. ISL-10 TaxID=2819172 RepID=UPI002035F8E1|nr:hypothetical protein [Streptomyces sp. ISL-10]